MTSFQYQNQQLQVQQIPVADIAEEFGTPLYIYAYDEIKTAWDSYAAALKAIPHKICYAVKANSNLAILNSLANLGAGFDIVSIGELERVLTAQGTADNIIFSGVGKQAAEINRALAVDIYCFNVESAAELTRINQLAQAQQKIAPIAIRVNPDIDAGTHPYISTGLKENKFGIDIEDAMQLFQYAKTLSHLKIQGIAYHIGSQLTEVSPFVAALERILVLVDALTELGIELQHIDIGGGLGVRYQAENPPAPHDYLAPILARLKNYNLTVIVEPGRALIANAGILVTRVEYLKHSAHKNFAIVDAAMNDLIRPALYEAWHDIVAVNNNCARPIKVYDIVGPICETADFLGKDRKLAIAEQDLLAIKSAGAYGFTMSSNYNSRPRAAEVMVKGNKIYLIRRRETVADLYALENYLL